tara:strand:- start:181 stop:486 length:306 start_codon:yes stop_codon:yes gene_type:complete
MVSVHFLNPTDTSRSRPNRLPATQDLFTLLSKNIFVQQDKKYRIENDGTNKSIRPCIYIPLKVVVRRDEIKLYEIIRCTWYNSTTKKKRRRRKKDKKKMLL